MDRYSQTNDKIFLLKSRDLYRQAFEACPSDYYTGINAASKSLLAGEKETASQLAKRVQDIVGDKTVPADYWKTATVAEALLFKEISTLLPASMAMRFWPRHLIAGAKRPPTVRPSCFYLPSMRPTSRKRRSLRRSHKLTDYRH
jgi:hypothetical protein